MYNYNCPDCNEVKLQSDKNSRKINEVIDQVNALIQVNNETVDFIEEKANEVVSELSEIKVNEVLGDLRTEIDTIEKQINYKEYLIKENIDFNKQINEIIPKIAKNGGYGVIKIPSGYFIVNEQIYFSGDQDLKGIRIIGSGSNNTILKFNNDGSSNQKGIPFIHFKNNRADKIVSGSIEDIQIIGYKKADDYQDMESFSNCHLIEFTNCHDFSIVKNCLLKETRGNGVSAIGSNNVLVYGNIIKDCSTEGVLASVQGSKCIISNNIISGSWWGIDSNMKETLISNNNISDCQYGITYESMDGKGLWNPRDCKITSNIVTRCNLGINTSSVSHENKVSNINISNNKIICTNIATHLGVGIMLAQVDNVTVEGNIIENSMNPTTSANTGNGINIGGGVTNCYVSNNIIKSFLRYGIAIKDDLNYDEVTSLSENITVIKNTINGGWAGINIQSYNKNVTVIDNIICDSLTGVWLKTQVQDKFICKNNIYENNINGGLVVMSGVSHNFNQNEISLSDGWSIHSNGGNVKYTYNSDERLVNIVGKIRSSSGASGNILILPSEIRPKRDMLFSVPMFNNDTSNWSIAYIQIVSSDGTLRILNKPNSSVEVMDMSISYLI